MLAPAWHMGNWKTLTVCGPAAGTGFEGNFFFPSCSDALLGICCISRCLALIRDKLKWKVLTERVWKGLNLLKGTAVLSKAPFWFSKTWNLWIDQLKFTPLKHCSFSMTAGKILVGWRCAYILSHFSRVWLSATLCSVAQQTPLSMGFSRQPYWRGLPCPPPGDLPNPGTEPSSLTSPALAGKFLTTSTRWRSRC